MAIISQVRNFMVLDSNFIAALVLHSHRRDQALKLNISRRTAGLLWYYNKKLSKELSDIARTSFLQGIIDGGKERMRQIMTIAPLSDEETKKKLVIEAKIIEVQITKATEALNG